MKKILIINNNMHIGGVQQALINLLHEICGEYEVSLLLFYPGGELMERIPDRVRVLTPTGALRYWGMSSGDPSGKRERLCRGLWAALTKTLGRGISFPLASIRQSKLTGYDAVISYLHSGPPRSFYGGCNEFALRCTESNHRVTFLHCDYEKQKADSRYNRTLYQKFDRIAACSEGCRDSFLRVMPDLFSKTTVVPNCLDARFIAAQADSAPIQKESGPLRVLTVSRLGREKGVLRAVEAIAELGPDKNRLRYTIIGDGIQRKPILEAVKALGLEDVVFWLGQMENPYGYLRAADLLLIPSYSEAAPMVIGEAAVLGTPILSTETSSARQMVEEAGIGLVCENSVAGIKNGLRQILDHPEALTVWIGNCEKTERDNHSALERFARLIERNERIAM